MAYMGMSTKLTSFKAAMFPDSSHACTFSSDIIAGLISRSSLCLSICLNCETDVSVTIQLPSLVQYDKNDRELECIGDNMKVTKCDVKW